MKGTQRIGGSFPDKTHCGVPQKRPKAIYEHAISQKKEHSLHLPGVAIGVGGAERLSKITVPDAV